MKWIGSVNADPHLDKRLARPPWRVDLAPRPRGEVPEYFDLVIMCRGIGMERGVEIRANEYRRQGTLNPFQFWTPDPYPVMGGRGLPSWSASEMESVDSLVVVLGGGDGAIQDMLRLLTNGRDARDVLDEIEPVIGSNLSNDLHR